MGGHSTGETELDSAERFDGAWAEARLHLTISLPIPCLFPAYFLPLFPPILQEK